ncbi:MAG TPA: glutathione S-transferase family protein [Alphaproteobacteria bacterium]|nr:glutathione S-transferase family protein [Alphaproteobacteria bacterium]
MGDLTLIIANKTYSSWSLRAWLALKATGAPFKEVLVPLGQPETRRAILQHTQSGRVPALKTGDLTIWDSLAVGEYLSEAFPDAGLWPGGRDARAVARSVVAEMHSGFADLRRHLPMDLKHDRSGKAQTPEVDADIGRILELWRTCRARFGAGGPFLFGGFSLADAFYAPVVTRFATYGVELDPVCTAYSEAVLDLPSMREWKRDALAEPWVLGDH